MLRPRSVSDLERGVNRSARKDTALLLAGALGLAGPARTMFVAAARGRVPAAEVLAAMPGQARGASPAAASTAAGGVHDFPPALTSFVGRAGAVREVADLVAAALGVRDQPGVPAAEALAGVLARQQLLLVLDNCEHVIGAAAALRAWLLPACDDVRILATRRRRRPATMGASGPQIQVRRPRRSPTGRSSPTRQVVGVPDHVQVRPGRAGGGLWPALMAEGGTCWPATGVVSVRDAWRPKSLKLLAVVRAKSRLPVLSAREGRPLRPVF